MSADKSTGGQVLAAPIASNVLIIGEAVVNGVVRGSYRYENVDENPEALSSFKWYLDDVLIPAPEGVEIDLVIKQSYAGKGLTFSVLPVASSGESGVETFSSNKFIESGYQGISDEENENSYLKQNGNFSFHVPEPPDRIFVSTGGVFGLIDPETQQVFFEGQAGWGLPVPPQIATLLKNNPATKMFTTERDFAALVNVGSSNQLLVWGAHIPVNHSVKLTDIKAVYSNQDCFAFIYKNPVNDDNRIGAIGLAGTGDVIPLEIQAALYFDEPLAIYATQNAFAVRTAKGKVYAWGNQQSGGFISPEVRLLLDGIKVERIVAAATAFCAISADGDIVTWGSAANGGNIPVPQLEAILNDGGAQSVVASTTAFCAITRNRRRAVTWGSAGEGGTLSAPAATLAVRGGIILCKSARWAFCMVNENGQAEAWGATPYGGATLTVAVKEEVEAAVLAISTRGMPVPATGHVGSRAITLDGTVGIYANDVSFFLLSQDEDLKTLAVVVTGMAANGGTMSQATRQVLMGSKISKVYCTNGAYGVVSNQGGVYGAVVVWGATLAMEDAGEIPPELDVYLRSDVVELYSIKRLPYLRNIPPPPPPPPTTPPHNDPSFAARRRDGSYVLWGGNVVNQYYKPTPEEE